MSLGAAALAGGEEDEALELAASVRARFGGMVAVFGVATKEEASSSAGFCQVGPRGRTWQKVADCLTGKLPASILRSHNHTSFY